MKTKEEVEKFPIGKIQVGDTPLSCQQQFAKKILVAHMDRGEDENIEKDVAEKKELKKQGHKIQFYENSIGKDISNPKTEQEYRKRNKEWMQNRRGFSFTNYWAGYTFDFPRIIKTQYWGNFLFEKSEKTGELYVFRIRLKRKYNPNGGIRL